MNTDRRLCGWRVRSEIALPELPLWIGDERAPDLTLRLGAVPDWPDIAPLDRTKVQRNHDGACRFAAPDVAVFLIDPAGHEVVVAPGRDGATPALRDCLLGTVLVILCQRRQLWPLHACCVRLGNKAVAFAGQSGAGKSTLAAAFLARGCEILSDDVTVIDISTAGGAMVLPAVPRVKMWRETATELGMVTDSVDDAGLHKDRLLLGEKFSLEPLPLAALYHLARSPGDGTLRFQPLRGMEAATAVSRAFHRRRLLIGLGGGGETLLAAAIGVAAKVPLHWQMERPFDLAALPDLTTAIAEHAGEML
jgi:hypothetical protein